MWRLALPVVLAVSMVSPGVASPWPREAGEWFLAGRLGAEGAGRPDRPIAEALVEHGLGDRAVLSLKLRVEGRAAAPELRLRWHPQVGGSPGGPPPAGSGRLWPAGAVMGLELGFGAAGPSDVARPVTALHVGRGFGSGDGRGGWLRGGVSVRPQWRGAVAAQEVSAQLGVRPGGGWVGMLSASVWRAGGRNTVKLSPALGRELAPGRTLLLEGTAGGDGTRALGLGLWQRF